MANNVTAAKLRFGDEIRRVRIFLGAFDLPQLKNLVKATFPEVEGEPVIKYLDNEGDLVTIKNNAELAEAIYMFRSGATDNLKSIKFIIGSSGKGEEAHKEVQTPPPVPVTTTSVSTSPMEEEAIPIVIEEVASQHTTTDEEAFAAVVERIADIVTDTVSKAVERAQTEDWSARMKEGADLVSESVAKVVERAQNEDWPARVKEGADVVADTVTKAYEKAQKEDWPARVKEGADAVAETVSKVVEKAKNEDWPTKVKEGASATGGAILYYGNEGSQMVMNGVKIARNEVEKMNDEEWKAFLHETVARIQVDVSNFLENVTSELSKLRTGSVEEAVPASVVEEAVVEESAAPADPKDEEWVIPQKEEEDLQEEVQSVASSFEEASAPAEWAAELSFIRDVFPEQSHELVVALLNKFQGNVQVVMNEIMDM